LEKAIPRENRQHIIAPAALWFGLVDLPDVIKWVVPEKCGRIFTALYVKLRATERMFEMRKGA